MKFLKEKFELCKEEIKSGTYLLNGAMSPVYYNQVVITGLKLNQIKWVENFIREYKNELEQSFRENTYNYCLSLLSFNKKRFEDSLEYLSKISFMELYQKTEVKTMQMMIYYETGAEEPLRFALEAFRHYISNSKLIPEQRKPANINFYKSLNKILSIKRKNEKFEIEKLKSKIMLLEKVTNKEWLIEKINELL